ncbi:MAG: hypothetical protein ACJ75G_07645 [Gaiellaceae bacterium]
MYCFRIRIPLDARSRINAEVEEFVLADGSGGGEYVLLKPRDRGVKRMSEAGVVVLLGQRYATAAEAEEAASRWATRLRVAFAGSLIGADFGLRAPAQHITPYGLASLRNLLGARGTRLALFVGRASGALGRILEVGAGLANKLANRLAGSQVQGDRILQDVHGTQVFECEPTPIFARWDLGFIVGRSPERFLDFIAQAEEKDISLSEKDELAFELFSGSFFESTADGRFLLLMMAVEALTVQEQRGEAATAHIEHLIAITRTATQLPADEVDSLVNGIREFKRESISRAGQRLAQTLVNRTYLEREPASFFKQCYRLRSKLVHGETPYPSFEEVNVQAGALELFVRDLLLEAHSLELRE